MNALHLQSIVSGMYRVFPHHFVLKGRQRQFSAPAIRESPARALLQKVSQKAPAITRASGKPCLEVKCRLRHADFFFAEKIFPATNVN